MSLVNKCFHSNLEADLVLTKVDKSPVFAVRVRCHDFHLTINAHCGVFETFTSVVVNHCAMDSSVIDNIKVRFWCGLILVPIHGRQLQ